MYKHFLIATDGSELADKAVAQGLAIAKGLGARVTGARVTVVTVSEQRSPAPGEMGIAMGVAFPSKDYEQAAANNAKATLEKAAEAAKAAGVPCETLLVKDRLPADAIIEVAVARGCDVIVMASHGRRGLSRLFLGSQTSKVLSHTRVPVLVIR